MIYPTNKVIIFCFCLVYTVCGTVSQSQDAKTPLREIRIISIGERVSVDLLKVAGGPTLFIFNPNSPDGVFRTAEEIYKVSPGEVPTLSISYDTLGRRQPSLMICRCNFGKHPPLEFDCPRCDEDTNLECPKGQSYECVSRSMSVIVQVEGKVDNE